MAELARVEDRSAIAQINERVLQRAAVQVSQMRENLETGLLKRSSRHPTAITTVEIWERNLSRRLLNR